MQRESTQQDSPHTVVVGAGFAGLKAARLLARKGRPVTLIDRHNYHLFTPLLYQVATGSLAPSEIAIPVRAVFRRSSRVRCIMGEVTNVDLVDKQVCIDGVQRISYDYLVLSMGAKSHYFGNEKEWKDRVETLDDLASAEELREAFLRLCEAAEREPDASKRRTLLTICIVGAGPSGVELAGAFSDLANRTLAAEHERIQARDLRVILLEAADRVLPAFEGPLSERARRQLQELGVEVRTDEPVQSVLDNQVETARESISCGLVCWGSGVRPADLTSSIDSEKVKGRLVVDQSCSLPGRPEVFAVGDIAHFETEAGEPLPALAPVAIQEGAHVARTIQRDARGQERQAFVYRDRGMMATIGRRRAVARSGPLRLSGMIAWLAWVVLHVAYLVSFRNRLLVLVEWLWSYVGARRGNRLVLSNESRPGHPSVLRRESGSFSR